MLKRASFIALLLTAFAATAAFAGSKKITTVHGTGNPALDRAAIQAAIDGAGKNDTIELVGTFQLDGTAIFLTAGDITIAGREVDDDGDGAVNEDWADGADNDGDGAVDEDGWNAVLQGVLTPDGRPDEVHNTFYNRGLMVDGVAGELRNISVHGIEFSGLVRGVSFGADAALQDGFLCSEVTLTDGSISQVAVRRNHFNNSIRGFQIFGASDHVTVRHNLMTDIRPSSATPSQTAYSVLLAGGSAGCTPDQPGDPASYPIGTPTRTFIADNTVIGSEYDGISGFGSVVDTRVMGNAVSDGTRIGIIFGVGTSGTRILHNQVTDFSEGIDIGGNGAHVLNNDVSGANTGIVLFNEATGNKLVNNVVSDVVFSAYFLAQPTFENMIRLNRNNDIADVQDLGTDNDIK